MKRISILALLALSFSLSHRLMAETAFVVTSGVQPAPINGVVVRPPVEQPIFTAELFASVLDDETQPSAGTLTMNEMGKRVSSFQLTQYKKPYCPPGLLCPLFIMVVQTRFNVLKAVASDCGRVRYNAVEDTPAARPRRLVVIDFTEDRCSKRLDGDWEVMLDQAVYYGEPKPLP